AENSERLAESKAHDRAVEGRAEVEKAVQRGAVAVLLLDDDDAERSDAEAAIVAQAIMSSAEIGLNHDPMAVGISAILRYDDAAALSVCPGRCCRAVATDDSIGAGPCRGGSVPPLRVPRVSDRSLDASRRQPLACSELFRQRPLMRELVAYQRMSCLVREHLAIGDPVHIPQRCERDEWSSICTAAER